MSKLIETNNHIALNRAFGVEELNEILEKALERPTEEKTKTRFTPSSLGYSGACPRYWYYAFHGAKFEYDNDPLAIVNMNNGTSAGQRIAELFDKAGLLVDAEVAVSHKDPDIFGYIDMMVRWKGEVIPAEVKTTKASTWNYRMLNNTVPGYQLAQLLIYMYLTNKDRGFFVTENKDDGRLFIYPVKMTDEYRQQVEDIFDWMRMVKANSDEDKLPTRPFTPSSWACKGCPLRNTCYEGFVKGNKSKGIEGSDPNPGVVDLPPLELPK